MRKVNNKIVFITSSFLGLFFLCQCTNPVENSKISPGNTTYYINPETGDDEDSGLKENRAWRTFSHINQLQLAAGDLVEITSPGSFDQTLILKGKGTADDPVEVHFAAGRYDFFTDNITRKKYNISNTNSQPDSLKAIGILLEGAKHFNKVVAVGEDYVDLQIHKDSEYRIEDGNIIWYGEGWTSNTRILG